MDDTYNREHKDGKKSNLIPITDPERARELGAKGGSVSSERKSLAAKYRELQKKQCITCTKHCILYDPQRADCMYYEAVKSIAAMCGTKDPDVVFDHFIEIMAEQRIAILKTDDALLRDKYLRRLLEFSNAKFGSKMSIHAQPTKLTPSQINDLIKEARQKRAEIEADAVVKELGDGVEGDMG